MFNHYVYDVDEDGYNDTIEFNYDPDTTCDCYVNITTYFDFYDNQTGNFVDSFDVEDEIYLDDNDDFYDEWSPSYNGTFDVIVRLYDEDQNLEDSRKFDNISLHVRSEDDDTGGESDEWFENHGYDVDSFEIDIRYDPDTDCQCEVRVWVYIDVYQGNNKIDTISEDYYIYNEDGDSFSQNWYADEEDYYDFYVVLFDGEDGPDNYEDDFWINDVYLRDDESGHNDSNNGIAHLAYIIPLDEDEYVNDFIGIVSFDNEVFFEISHEGNVVESGYSEDGMWSVSNLQEGWYEFEIKENDNEDENTMHFQSGSFYSYGDNSHDSSDIVNVGIAVGLDENLEGDLELECDAGPCDDVGIIAYIGDPDDGGVQDIDFDIFQWNSEEGNWDYYVTLTTNESGIDILHDTPCGEYMWMTELNGNEASGIFEVHANCDSDRRAWFDYVEYLLYDEDDDNREDYISIDYAITVECSDCEYMDLLLILDVFNQNNEMVVTFEEYFSVEPSDTSFITFAWYNNISDEEYTFFSSLEYLVDGDTDGEILAQDGAEEAFFLAIFNDEPSFYIEDLIGRDIVFEGQNVEFELILQGSNNVVVDWNMGDGIIYQNVFKVYHTYQHSGNYEIMVKVYDDDDVVEQYFDINVRNLDPIILNIMMDNIVNEGDDVSFNVQYEDVPRDMDNISVRWIFPDGIQQGNFVQYKFVDDGEFLISVEIKDDDGGITTEQRMVTVQNVAPVFTEFILPSQGEQGVALDFVISATDPGDDTITYTFDFGDGTAMLVTQNGNASHKFASGDSFEIIICAIDEDGGETCRSEVIPVALLEQIEDSGLPGFGFLGVISALGAITLLRRRTH